MKNPRFFITFMVIFSLVSTGVAFYTYYVKRSYLVFANVLCDPAAHSCFVGDGEYAPLTYAVVSRPAYTIPACDGWKDECEELSCADQEEACVVTYCEPNSEDLCTGASEL